MGLIGYTPWHDAANFGQGLGQIITQALFQVPAQRREQAMQEREFGLKERQLAAQEGLNQMHAQLYQAQAASMPKKLELDKLIADSTVALKALQGEHQKELAALARTRSGDVSIDNKRAEQESAAEIARKIAETERLKAELPWIGPVRQSTINRNSRVGQPKPMDTASEAFDFVKGLYYDPLGRPGNLTNLLQNFDQINQRYGQGRAPLAPPAPPPQLAPQPQFQAPQWNQGPVSAPPPMMAPMGLPAANPAAPTPPSLLRIRSRSTGRTGWATPADVQMNPDFEPLPPGIG